MLDRVRRFRAQLLDRRSAADVAGVILRRLPVHLVPAFDEYLIGWQSREHAIPDEHRVLVHPGGGIIRSAVLVDGLAVATWQTRRTPGRIDITVQPFASMPEHVRPKLSAEALGRSGRRRSVPWPGRSRTAGTTGPRSTPSPCGPSSSPAAYDVACERRDPSVPSGRPSRGV
jgi:hypothetical protein